MEIAASIWFGILFVAYIVGMPVYIWSLRNRLKNTPYNRLIRKVLMNYKTYYNATPNKCQAKNNREHRHANSITFATTKNNNYSNYKYPNRNECKKQNMREGIIGFIIFNTVIWRVIAFSLHKRIINRLNSYINRNRGEPPCNLTVPG